MFDIRICTVFLLLIVSACGGDEQPRADSGKHGEDSPQQIQSKAPNITPDNFMRAALTGDFKQVQQAAEQGIDIQQADQTGKTALMLASYNGHVDIIQYLLDRGAQINKQDNQGLTPLLFAASGPFPDAVKLLLDEGAAPNATDTIEKWTPLMYAAAEGNREVVKVLLDYGADTSLEDADGDKAVDFAKNNGHVEVVALLEQ